MNLGDMSISRGFLQFASCFPTSGLINVHHTRLTTIAKMRPPTMFASAAVISVPLAIAQGISQPINITQVEQVDQKTRIGQLAYGASNLDFGYSAGAGINFGNGEAIMLEIFVFNQLIYGDAGTVGGGFNAGIPGQSEGGLGGGWTVTANNITFGLGAVVNNVTVDVAIFADRTTGELTVKVNGNAIAL